ncbi:MULTISPECIES: ATP-grasp domain-containing protein [Gracilibacillus]|uniref:ATP-grasp domain-containing protein n=1 Tax=Gracilibacillus TaxID=74385 RepID=UPI0008241EC3|nr:MULTISPECIES: ATP-grasp domain-containing protein [Gracilibacillus]
MKLISFNAFRTIGIPGITYIKPELMFREMDVIKQADVILFPETWQVSTLVYGLNKSIFPSIETLQIGADKIEMTRVLQGVVPQHVPYTEILSNTAANITKILDTFPFPFVAKEVKSSMGQGVFLITDKQELLTYAQSNEVLYIQEYLPNDGQDLRVCVVGDEVYAAYWRSGQKGDFLHNIAQGGEVHYTDIPNEAVQMVRQLAKRLHINHAGFDVLYSHHRYYILEFNVLFGNQGLSQQPYTVAQTIYQYLSRHNEPPFPTSPLPRKVIS